jgi:hypothetical protein
VFLGLDEAGNPGYDAGWDETTVSGDGFTTWTIETERFSFATLGDNASTDTIHPLLFSENGNVFELEAYGRLYFASVIGPSPLAFSILDPASARRELTISANDRMEGETFYFVSQVQVIPEANGSFFFYDSTDTELGKILLPYAPTQFVISVYPSHQVMLVQRTDLNTGETQTTTESYASSTEFPESFRFKQEQPHPPGGCSLSGCFGGGTRISRLWFNDLRYDPTGTSALRVINEVPSEVTVGDPSTSQTITYQFNDVTDSGFVYATYEQTNETPPGVPADRVIRQRYSITTDNQLSFRSANVTVTYDDTQLGTLPETDINHAFRVKEGIVTEILGFVNTEANTINFNTNSFSDWYFGFANIQQDLINIY